MIIIRVLETFERSELTLFETFDPSFADLSRDQTNLFLISKIQHSVKLNSVGKYMGGTEYRY